VRQGLRIVSAVTACAAVALVAGCGLKGPLTMPERSSNVVIRGPSGEVVSGPATPGATSASGATDTGAAAAAPPTDSATPVTPTSPVPSATKKPATDPDRMPPPPLPGGNPGSPGG
jgi:hypothetical protein